MRFSVISLQFQGLAELSKYLIAVCAFAPKYQAEHVVQICTPRIFGNSGTKAGYGRVPVWRGRRGPQIESGFQLAQGHVDLVQPQKNDTEIDVVCGLGRGDGDRSLEVDARTVEIAGFALHERKQRITGAGGRIQANTRF